MPSPKRWFPVSREVNHDPELWEMTELYGDRALRIWLELLAWADKNDNHVQLSGRWVASLAQLTKTNLKTVVRVVAWILDRGWIVIMGDQNIAEKWIETLRHLSKDFPKTGRRLAEDLPETHRRMVEEWAENGRRLSLCTANYWKYHRRPDPTGNKKEAGTDSLPVPPFPSLPKDKEREEGKRAGSTSSAPASGARNGRKVSLADEEFIAALKNNPAYAGIDIDREIGKLQAWLQTPKGFGKHMTRSRVVNWLNRVDKPMNRTATVHGTQRERIPL
jgi:hypothetical protein